MKKAMITSKVPEVSSFFLPYPSRNFVDLKTQRNGALIFYWPSSSANLLLVRAWDARI